MKTLKHWVGVRWLGMGCPSRKGSGATVHMPAGRPLHIQAAYRLDVESEWVLIESLSGAQHALLQWSCTMHLQQLLDPIFPGEMVMGEGLNTKLQDMVEDFDQAILGQVIDS